ncbi:hypothetical protein DEO72_LG9g1436 [Vigna unguiculata]|uniref:Nucleic acid-binding n=1 Tax=Vigna unguiculata TaxID=3917 RepID=A0A4D6N0K9_VIGUN|nr:hypothetical protein DEO72_LG9g1436 [Vigna unguiculata]
MDLSGGVVSCTLWDEYCKKFLERYNDNPNSDKLVIILTQAKVKAATGTYAVILLWYKLQLQVCDDAFNYANFVVWDQECRNIIDISAEELQMKMIKVGEDDPKCFPDELDVMLGCTLAFKLRTQPRNKCASVIKVSDLPEIINYIKKLIQPLGECSHKNIIDLGGDTSTGMIVDFRSKGVCNLAANSDHDLIADFRSKGVCNLAADSDHDLMSLSGTADNDPDNSSLGTPSKRIVPNSGVSVQSSEDIESGELSATKPMKTIKQEID